MGSKPHFVEEAANVGDEHGRILGSFQAAAEANQLGPIETVSDEFEHSPQLDWLAGSDVDGTFDGGFEKSHKRPSNVFSVHQVTRLPTVGAFERL